MTSEQFKEKLYEYFMQDKIEHHSSYCDDCELFDARYGRINSDESYPKELGLCKLTLDKVCTTTYCPFLRDYRLHKKMCS